MFDSSNIQIALLFLASAAFALAFVLSWRDLRTVSPVSAVSPDLAAQNGAGQLPVPLFRPAPSRAIILGSVVALVLLVWRGHVIGKLPQALYNHFDTFLCLALLLIGLMFYFRITRHLRGLAYFLLPMISLLLLLGGLLAVFEPPLDYRSAWTIIHVIAILAGSVCFAAACVAGSVYLLADAQLRHTAPTTHWKNRWKNLPPLAALEKANQFLILLGFPLLTLGMVVGYLQIVLQPHAMADLHALWPKVLLALLAWLIYALLLHVRFAPAFRGRRAAYLSILGFVLLLAVWTTVNWMPRLVVEPEKVKIKGPSALVVAPASLRCFVASSLSCY